MPHRRNVLAVALLLAAVTFAATKKPAPPARAAGPDQVPHNVAIFLDGLTNGGKRRVTINAAAVKTRFFLEDASGVTVYNWDGHGGYDKETFIAGATLAKATARY
jgi:hypothetical protein